MQIPFKIRQFNRIVVMPRFVIIHDVNCQAHNFGSVKIDNKECQINKLRNIEYKINNQPDLNYHYVVEMIREDYEALMGRPFGVRCDYPDIPRPHEFAFHVCIMGDFNLDIPDNRLYQKIAYNILAPTLKMFRIPMANIFLHSEVTTDKEIHCPGNFFDKKRMINQLRSMRLF